MKMPDPKMGLVLAALLAAMMAPANAGVESTHEVPDWMTRSCTDAHPVNCWSEVVDNHPERGPAFIRMMPGRARMVCVLHADRPRFDYCQATR